MRFRRRLLRLDESAARRSLRSPPVRLRPLLFFPSDAQAGRACAPSPHEAPHRRRCQTCSCSLGRWSSPSTTACGARARRKPSRTSSCACCAKSRCGRHCVCRLYGHRSSGRSVVRRVPVRRAERDGSGTAESLGNARRASYCARQACLMRHKADDIPSAACSCTPRPCDATQPAQRSSAHLARAASLSSAYTNRSSLGP